jgi:hypothetical protein
MRYVRVYATADDGSKFEDVEVEGTATHVVDGVPPLRVSAPFPVNALLFVEQPKDATDWHAHPAPRRQWVMALSGRVEVTTSDGERRQFGPATSCWSKTLWGRGTSPLRCPQTSVS